jgi:septal ring factor EnvC (AmiA/AmiB activator)
MAKKSSAASLESMSAADLKAELQRRERRVNSLVSKRDRIAAKLKVLDKQIASMGGAIGTGIRTRPRNATNLVEAMSKVLDGKTMSVTEVAEAVQKAGYQTTSPSFRIIVNQALLSSGKFKRVARGQYTAK